VLGAWLALYSAATPAIAAARSEFRFSRWGTEHGLPHNSVYAIAQDLDGFVWVGTVDGLSRFDGHEFRNFRRGQGASPASSSQVIRSLLGAADGSLWVGSDEGLDRFRPSTEQFERIPLPLAANTMGRRTVHELHEDGHGTLWIATDHGLLRRDGDRTEAVLLAGAGAQGDDILGLQEAKDGRLWLLAGSPDNALSARLVRLDPRTGAQAHLSLPAGWAAGRFTIDSRGRFWLGGSEPHPPGPTGFPDLAPPPSPVFAAYSLVEDASDSATHFLGNEHGLFRHRAGTREELLLRPDQPSWLNRYVRSLFRDRAGAIWIGTYDGLFRFDPHAKPFVHWRHDRGDANSLSTNAVSSILAEESGTTWIGTFGGGLDRADPVSGSVTRFRHRPDDRTSLPSDVVWALWQDPLGGIYVATEGGLAQLDPRTNRARRIALPLPADAAAQGWLRVVSITADGSGRLWLGSHTGFYSYDPRSREARRFTVGTGSLGSQGENVESILVAPDGTLWLGTTLQGLVHYHPETGERQTYPLLTDDGSVLSSEGIWTIERDASGNLWLGSGAGLSRFDPETERFAHFTTRDGLPGAFVYSILRDPSGRLWLGTNRGLSCFDDRLPVGKKFRTFLLSDGIGSIEFNRRAATAGHNGRFYFGGVSGLTEFDPAAIRDDSAPPPVVLTAVEVLGRDGVVSKNPVGLERLVMSPRQRGLVLSLAALHFADPQRNTYAYRLDGFDHDWVQAGTARQVRYTNIPHGSYTLRVRAANPDGVWNERGLALPIVVVPTLAETWWFRASVAVALATLLAWAYRWRVRRLLELEQLRVRIASDLHDDLSSDLAGIAIATDLLRQRPRLGSEEREQLLELRDRSLRMVEAVRDTVWYVNPEHDSIDALVRRMRRAARQLLGETAHEISVSLPPGSEALDMAARRGIFLIFKELLHNAARHAQASRVEIELAAAGDHLTLHVRDNGIGFEPGKTAHGEGLNNMQRRAREIGAHLDIQSAQGCGTSVTLRMARSRDSGGPPDDGKLDDGSQR
jgi:ligand-binding sensor domain-containing protein/signal transduction histidine kinase